MLRIRRLDTMPPGGFSYVQPETGMKFDGNTPLRSQGRLVETHRKANGLSRATFEEAIEDLEATICGRTPGVCFDTNSIVNTARVITRGCSTCGGRRK